MSEVILSPSDLEKLADMVAVRLATKLGTGDELLDIHQAAKLLNCSVPSIERATRSGRLLSVKIGRLRRYKRSDLLNSGG